MYEFNFIWAGPKSMPPEQLANLDQTHLNHPTAKINIWVMPEVLHVDLQAHFQAQGYEMLDIDQLFYHGTTPATDEIFKLAKQAGIWAGISDISRLLILTRPQQPGQPTQRFYMEADNEYPLDLEDVIQNRGFVLHIQKNGQFRTDSFYIDLEHEYGIWLKKGLRTHLELFFTDPIINEDYKKLIGYKTNVGLSHMDITLTFGEICHAILRKSMHRVVNFMYNHGSLNFSSPCKYAPMSWVENKEPRVQVSALAILLRGYQINLDISGKYKIDDAKDVDDYSKLFRVGFPEPIRVPFINLGMFLSSRALYTQNPNWQKRVVEIERNYDLYIFKTKGWAAKRTLKPRD
jgi:hypothetical protein